MDFASIIGIVLAFASLVASLILDNGNVGSLLKLSAAVLVFGGTIGATMVCFTFDDMKKLPGMFKIAFTKDSFTPVEIIDTIVRFAEKARREGLLALETDISEMDDEFLKKGVQLIVDGTDPQLVRDILETELSCIEERHHKGAAIFEAAGGYAPTMGIIGTVMGLVNALGNMADTSSLGEAIATAFIATLYGISTANIIWLPLGAKLKARSSAETLMREVMLEGILSIQAGENPHIVKEKLKAFLAPEMRNQNSGGSED